MRATHHHPVTSTLRQQLAVFSTLDPENRGMYLHHMEIFLFIAEKGRASYADIEKEFSISNASASRSLNTISEFARHRKQAIGLISIFRDPSEGRRYAAKLTAKGEQVAKLLANIGDFASLQECVDSLDQFDENTPV